MRKSVKLWRSALLAGVASAFVTFIALAAVSGSATAATLEPDREDAAPGAAVSPGEGPPAMRGVVPTLSAEARARSAKGLVDLNGNRLSDGLEDRLAGLAANAQLDVIVMFSAPGNAASAQAAVGAFSVRYEYNIIDGFAATMTAGQARALATAPGVFRVQEDATVYAFMESARPDFGVEDLALDPYTAGMTGNGVRICMVDTGIQNNHEAFNIHNPDGSIVSSRIVGFQDFTGDLNGVFHDVPYDYHGHGTHTAATAAGDGEAGPVGSGGDTVHAPKARGVAPGASLLIAKVLRGDGAGADSGVLAGIEWCVAQDADIISASLGIPGSSLCSDAVCVAMNNAALAGVLPVVAAGNSGDLPENIGSPAASPLSLTVAAAADFSANPADPWATSGVYLAPFSSLGPTANGETKPDITAPGVTILSAYSDEYVLCDPLFGCLPETYSYGCGIGCYAILSGTSMATPYVSGVAALMLEANPDLTSAEIKQIIEDTAHDRLTPGKDVAYGHGLIDAMSAVNRALDRVEGEYTPNEFPSYFVGTDSVPDSGYTDIPITVADTSLPLAVSITIDGDVSCAAMFLGVCLGYSWDPDLEMDLYTSNAAGDLGVLAFSSGCPAIGDCGTAGQRETAYVPANAATTHYLARIYGWDGDPNFGKGGTFTYEISNGVDSRGGGPAPSTPPTASFTVSCPDLSCSFTDSSTGGDGTIVGWSWDFGDDDTSTAQSPGHTYASSGTYTVVLTVIDDADETGSTSQDVTMSEPPGEYQPPVANAGIDQTVTFPDPLTLAGSASYVPASAGIQWTLISKPRKSDRGSEDIIVDSADALLAIFYPDVTGTYEFELMISDGETSSSDTVVVTVDKAPKSGGGGGGGGSCNPKKPGCTAGGA